MSLVRCTTPTVQPGEARHRHPAEHELHSMMESTLEKRRWKVKSAAHDLITHRHEDAAVYHVVSQEGVLLAELVGLGEASSSPALVQSLDLGSG